MHESFKVHVINRGRKFLYLRFVDPLTRKTIEESSKCTTLTEARKAAGVREKELREGKYKPRSKMTWQEFRKRYDDEVLAGLADTTDAKNSGVLNSVEEVLNPGRPLDLTTERISHYAKVLRGRGLAEFTIRGHLSVIRSVLRWAADMDFIPEAPKIKMPERARDASMAKGRPITGEEFERMIAAAREIVGTDNVEAWKFLLRGLWWSGLRLGEALNLSWDGDSGLVVNVSGDDVMLLIPGDSQKSGKEQLLTMAPEFAEQLLGINPADRTGLVFKLPGNPAQDAVSETIGAIGEKAAIKVKTTERPTLPKPQEGEKRKVRGRSKSEVKYASAHDLRRSFCQRWARLVMPQVLMELARHESYETTMKFYATRNAKETAKILRAAVSKAKSDRLSDTCQDGPSEKSTQPVEAKERTAQDSNLQPSVP
jgi:integrase